MQSGGFKPFLIKSTLTRPANTTAYHQNQLIASSTSANSIVVPSFNIAALLDPEAEYIEITKGVIFANATLPSTVALHTDLWLGTAPTFTNGDGGPFAVATGEAAWCGHLTSDIVGVNGSGGDGSPMNMSTGQVYVTTMGQNIPLIVGRNQLLYWSLLENDATGFTPTSGEQFTLALQGFRY